MKEINEIEKDIKNASSTYEIKLSADDILQAYEKRQVEKSHKRVFHFPKFKFAFGTLACASIVLLAVLIPTLTSNHHSIIDPQKNVKWGTRSQTAFQLYTGLSLVSNDKSMMKFSKRDAIDDASFDDLVVTYNKSVDTLNLLFQDGLDKENTIEKGNYEGQYGKYQYRMTISQYIFLNNMSFEEDDEEKETEFIGEIINQSGPNYYVEIKKEQDIADNEDEIEMTIHISENHRIEIEQEHEANEVEYQYSIYEYNNLVYEENISIENKKDKISYCDIEIIKDQNEYAFGNIHYEGKILLCEYQMEDFEGVLSLDYLENSRQYKDQETQKIKIIS